MENEKEPKPTQDAIPLLLVKVLGEGYITRKNGEVIPFTFEGEG